MSAADRILNVLIALDQLVYVLVTLGAGFPDETLSSAAYRMEVKGKIAGKVFRPLIDAIFFLITVGNERQHCQNSYLSERKGAHLPPELR